MAIYLKITANLRLSSDNPMKVDKMFSSAYYFWRFGGLMVSKKVLGSGHWVLSTGY